MKNSLFFLIIIIFACSKTDIGTNPNTNSNANHVDYEFSITINSDIHKIKGNTINGNPFGIGLGLPDVYSKNVCSASDRDVHLKILDVSENTYLSGRELLCTLSYISPFLGVNNVMLVFDNFQGGYWKTLIDSLGVTSNFGFSTTKGGTVGSGGYNIPVNITDLGDEPIKIFNNQTMQYYYSHTKTLKGNFKGILYLQNLKNGVFDVPIKIEIDFKAVRMY